MSNHYFGVLCYFYCSAPASSLQILLAHKRRMYRPQRFIKTDPTPSCAPQQQQQNSSRGCTSAFGSATTASASRALGRSPSSETPSPPTAALGGAAVTRTTPSKRRLPHPCFLRPPPRELPGACLHLAAYRTTSHKPRKIRTFSHVIRMFDVMGDR